MKVEMSVAACDFSSNLRALRQVQYWQLIDIPRLITGYCFHKEVCSTPNPHPSLLALFPGFHRLQYGNILGYIYTDSIASFIIETGGQNCQSTGSMVM